MIIRGYIKQAILGMSMVRTTLVDMEVAIIK